MADKQPKLLPLINNKAFIASTLYAPSREVIVNWLYNQLNESAQIEFKSQRLAALQKGQRTINELKLDGIPSDLLFGEAALNAYLEEPEEGYYIKSPKSFLGASGLLPAQIELFEDIAAAMMSNIKTLAEQSLKRELEQVVIGRPINFQGLQGQESNRQAINVLTTAAKRIGFKEVEFQYEPVAAGFEYEQQLSQETRVLVVDIGGGTTDCSMLLMGPNLKNQLDRSEHLLAHSGLRVGGNDFDIQLAIKGLMPSFGLGSLLKNNKPMPSQSYWQAMAINNLHEQSKFYSAENERYLQQLKRDAQQEQLVERLLKVQQQKLSYRLVNEAEQGKVALSRLDNAAVDLRDISAELSVNLSSALMAKAIEKELAQIGQLMQQAIEQAQCQADVIFVTGGTAKSPVLKQFLQQQMPNIPIVVGDHFGSVAAGLTRWAEKIYA